MLRKTIEYFSKQHLLSNFIFISVIVGGIFAWQNTSKEEMPAITFDQIRISVTYPGAPAEDVEYFVTKPIEEKLRGLDGVYRITSNSGVGQANITVEIEQNYPDLDEAVTEIRNSVSDVDLPAEVINDPSIRIFKTTKKAILDVAIYSEKYPILNFEGRRELQKYAYALENQLLGLAEVNSVNKQGYLQEEIQIRADPQKLVRYEIPFNAAMREIRENNIRKPAGNIEADKEPKVTLLSELDSPEKLENLVIQGGFEGKLIKLNQVADVQAGFEKTQSITKVNGHEAIMFSVVKNSSVGILEALESVSRRVNQFKRNNLEGTPIRVELLDDESIDIRNRLYLISVNGAIGFALILVTLFIFLNKRSGFWVAMGIPFTFCFTMIFASLMGQTINGITLAAVIIVMGMIVDDAIVVSENITRLQANGVPTRKAIVDGTSFVVLPIVASILTTCVAFIPLYFFQGRFGKFIEFIPMIIFLMLGASLLESIFILPGHMQLGVNHGAEKKTLDKKEHWFEKIEDRYGIFLEKILPYKFLILVGFLLVLILSGLIVSKKMSFVMFPNEETRDLVLSGSAPEGTGRYETARMVRKIEDIFIPYIGKEVVGFRTSIAQSRRGGAVQENEFRMIVEVVPKDKRKKSADQLISEFEEKFKDIEGFTKLKFSKSRWGQDSGSPVELIVQQNIDQLRSQVVDLLKEEMMNTPGLMNVEVDGGFFIPEYKIDINREKIKRLSIQPADVASTLRAALEGTVLFEFSNGDEDVHVRFTTVDEAKTDINKVLELPVENKGNYLVPLKSIVSVKEVISPNSISRRDLKRTTLIYADINKELKRTPLEIADEFEEKVFPKILSQFPTTILSFGGEIQDTRESKRDFKNAILLTLFLIFIILSLLFNSLLKPLLIMLAIPFGLVGIIFAFYLHGKTLFGFYAAVGALGLSGVVINDSIIMLVKLNSEFKAAGNLLQNNFQIAQIAKTRLRAVILTTITTVAGVLPTAYGFGGYDAMLAEMMLTLTWGMIFGTLITLILIPCIYSYEQQWRQLLSRKWSSS